MGTHILLIGSGITICLILILCVVGAHQGGNVAGGEILKFNGSWTDMGMMQNKRFDAAAARIMINTNHGLDISECL